MAHMTPNVEGNRRDPLAGACPVDRAVWSAARRYSESLAFDSDNVRLDLAVDGTGSEPSGDGGRREVGCFAEP
jgi:hypothetical protein